jgi:hypothetical protein
MLLRDHPLMSYRGVPSVITRARIEFQKTHPSILLSLSAIGALRRNQLSG